MNALSKLALVAVAAIVLGAGSARAAECPDFTKEQLMIAVENRVGAFVVPPDIPLLGLRNRFFHIGSMREAFFRQKGSTCYLVTVSNYVAKHAVKELTGTVNYKFKVALPPSNPRSLCVGTGSLSGGKFSGGPVQRKLDKKRAGLFKPSGFCVSIR